MKSFNDFNREWFSDDEDGRKKPLKENKSKRRGYNQKLKTLDPNEYDDYDDLEVFERFKR